MYYVTSLPLFIAIMHHVIVSIQSDGCRDVVGAGPGWWLALGLATGVFYLLGAGSAVVSRFPASTCDNGCQRKIYYQSNFQK